MFIFSYIYVIVCVTPAHNKEKKPHCFCSLYCFNDWTRLFGTKSVVTPAYYSTRVYFSRSILPCGAVTLKRTETTAVCDPALFPADCDTAAVMSPEISFLKAQHYNIPEFTLPSRVYFSCFHHENKHI